jgi:hypothetical protein
MHRSPSLLDADQPSRFQCILSTCAGDHPCNFKQSGEDGGGEFRYVDVSLSRARRRGSSGGTGFARSGSTVCPGTPVSRESSQFSCSSNGLTAASPAGNPIAKWHHFPVGAHGLVRAPFPELSRQSPLCRVLANRERLPQIPGGSRSSTT